MIYWFTLYFSKNFTRFMTHSQQYSSAWMKKPEEKLQSGSLLVGI